MLTVRIQAIDGAGTFTLPDFQPCRLLIPPADLPGAPQLNTSPVVSPVNASRRPSRDAAHHSGSGRMASPYPMGDFHLLFFASLPGALRVGSFADIPGVGPRVRFTLES